MKHALREWAGIRKVLRRRTILLFLDFDGTLAPIVSIPAKACLPPGARELLKRLSLQSEIRLIVISGRDIDDVRKRVAVPGAVYVGSHGCRISGHEINWDHVFPVAYRSKLRRLFREVSVAMKDICGVHIESKDLSVAVHYRNVRNRDLPVFFDRMERISAPYIASSCIKKTEGKKVVEFCMATTWNKGRAVKWLLRSMKGAKCPAPCMPLYIGDDKTDEHAFEALKGKGVSIHVGTGKQTAAGYRLKNTAEVLAFLWNIYTFGLADLPLVGPKQVHGCIQGLSTNRTWPVLYP